MLEFWRAAIRRQFHAAIDMLGNAIEACPNTVWFGRERGAFWYLAFHVLFFLDLYLSSEDESRFRPPAPFGLSELEDEVVVPEPGYGKEGDEQWGIAFVQHAARATSRGSIEHAASSKDGFGAGLGV